MAEQAPEAVEVITSSWFNGLEGRKVLLSVHEYSRSHCLLRQVSIEVAPPPVASSCTLCHQYLLESDASANLHSPIRDGSSAMAHQEWLRQGTTEQRRAKVGIVMKTMRGWDRVGKSVYLPYALK